MKKFFETNRESIDTCSLNNLYHELLAGHVSVNWKHQNLSFCVVFASRKKEEKWLKKDWKLAGAHPTKLYRKKIFVTFWWRFRNALVTLFLQYCTSFLFRKINFAPTRRQKRTKGRTKKEPNRPARFLPKFSYVYIKWWRFRHALRDALVTLFLRTRFFFCRKINFAPIKRPNNGRYRPSSKSNKHATTVVLSRCIDVVKANNNRIKNERWRQPFSNSFCLFQMGNNECWNTVRYIL